jgi:hypothetical protein
MKKHVFLPLLVVTICVTLLLIARNMVVPSDFGVNGENFTFGFFRLSSIDDWKNFKVKYRGRDYCQECHEEKVEEILNSPHAVIQCENCHGPAIDHPEDPEVLPIETSRLLCRRCHAFLPYPQSNRADMPAINPEEHNPGENCVECHNPHNPDLEGM